jgi:hypothetical protein
LFVSGLCALFVLSACQGLQRNPVNREDLLQQRLDQYIQARIAADAVVLYDFFSPAFQETVSLESFKIQPMYKVEQMTLISIDFSEEPEKARVILKGQVKIMGFTFKNMKFAQDWVFVDDNWYQDAKTNPFRRLFQKNSVPRESS